MITVLRSKCVKGALVTNDYLLMFVQFAGSHTVKSIIIIAAVAAAVHYKVWRGYFVSSYSKFC
jgi:hypothetical protein